MKTITSIIFLVSLIFILGISCRDDSKVITYCCDDADAVIHVDSLRKNCDTSFALIIPNVISPNGDGINDVYLPKIICNGKRIQYKIFVYSGSDTLFRGD